MQILIMNNNGDTHLIKKYDVGSESGHVISVSAADAFLTGFMPIPRHLPDSSAYEHHSVWVIRPSHLKYYVVILAPLDFLTAQSMKFITPMAKNMLELMLKILPVGKAFIVQANTSDYVIELYPDGATQVVFYESDGSIVKTEMLNLFDVCAPVVDTINGMAEGSFYDYDEENYVYIGKELQRDIILAMSFWVHVGNIYGVDIDFVSLPNDDGQLDENYVTMVGQTFDEVLKALLEGFGELDENFDWDADEDDEDDGDSYGGGVPQLV